MASANQGREGAEVTAVAFVIELPWDLGIPDDFELRTPQVSSDSNDRCWLRFRTVEIPTQLPLAASDLAFGEADGEEELGEAERRSREHAMEAFIETPFLASRTVVAVYVSRAGDQPDFNSKPLSEGLQRGVEALNDCLISLGVLFNDRIRPVSVDELPPAIPVIAARRFGDHFIHGRSQLLHLREYSVGVQAHSEAEMGQVERMLALVAPDQPLSSFYELIQRAGSARRTGRHREAVIDYGTAGELFTTAMFAAVAERRGTDAGKATNILEGPFKDRARHLCRLLKFPEDPEAADSPFFFWWLHCYSQRNGIVHRGAGSIAPLSEAARIGLVELVVEVRDALRREDDLSDLATMIRWGRRVDHTGGGRDSEPEPFEPAG